MGHRDTWAEISLDAISHNAELFKTAIGASCRLMAVVKANGYGHGAAEVAAAAIAAGADWLGVAILDEALQLRAAGIDLPILVLGYTPPRSVEAAVLNRVTLTVYSADVLGQLIACTERLQRRAAIHLKIDTGMSRIGVTSKEAALALAQQALASRHVDLEGMFTHFAEADNPESPYTRRQFETFRSYIEFLHEHHIDVPLKHCCNSAAAMHFPDMHLDMVRVGIALYGLKPSADIDHPGFPLRQAMQLKTRVSAVKRISAGQSVSYGRTFTAASDCTVATIPVGYADGLSRQLSGKGFALIGHTRVPIIGRVCMDQTMLDATSVPDVQAGDEVVLFGGTEQAFIAIDEVAAHMNTINYEVVCLIGQRVPRVYVRSLSV
ncbi:alanine racemase [Gordoniibacillus kamchatkensis]|uniref:Alanine racemase n=1 Tax=Gordoniibacillus kamchatkensis TaxID=1590651 RepID=A0ABR5AH55_9BACL|nr:alanine racemase [Paenibacillus sp. VKM B-2647]